MCHKEKQIVMLLYVRRCERQLPRMEYVHEYEEGFARGGYWENAGNDQCRRAARWKTASGKLFCEQCRPRQSRVTCLLTGRDFSPTQLNAPKRWPEEIGVEGLYVESNDEGQA